MAFRVDLDIFRGPMDLLLYLVRKHELDITDIPMAMVAEQFLQHLDVLQELDVDAVGDFIEMASTLMEIKSRLVLPRGGEDVDQLDDPREELVERLLEYKKYKDAASILEEQSQTWQQHLPRAADDLPPRRIDPAGQPIQEIELWDLVSAFGRIVRDNRVIQPSNIVYDDTPIHVHVEQICQRLQSHQRVAFSELFTPGMHKSAVIGMFLAILELVRHHSVSTEQSDLHGEIWILPGENFHSGINLAQLDVDDYGQADDNEEIPTAKPK